MSLDSWIDERTLAMMRALAPTRGNEPPAQAPAEDFGFDPLPGKEETLPEAVEPARIAPSLEPDAATIQRLRSRLAEIRRRAEVGGVVRSAPARIAPSVPVAQPLASEEPPVPPSLPPVSDAPATPAPENVPPAEPDEAGTQNAAPVPVKDLSSAPMDAEPAPAASLPEVSGSREAVVVPADQVPAPASGSDLVIPEGPLAVRLDAYRRWLESECGLSNPVVFDRHGCPLHPAEGQASFIAAAVSLGVAWREACALTDPPGTLRAVHSGWGAGTMAVIPVPTRFGDLYVAGQVGAAIEVERAAEIGSALRRTAGV
jgi:hypothetical protein